MNNLPIVQGHSGEHLAFSLGEEEYAVAILSVQEIRSFQQPTTIAGAPSYMLGVINLRGSIVPIIDLRVKIGRDSAVTPQTVIIVLSMNATTLGIVVDSVSDVIEVKSGTVVDTPVSVPESVNFISGIIKHEKRLLMLVDMSRLVNNVGVKTA